MFDFSDVVLATKAEQIRAFAIEAAIEYGGVALSNNYTYNLIDSAVKIEKFILSGASETEGDDG